ncbi:auxin-responsive protein IAA26-like [Andrographis paniculata]|uniref:auxin-responsive protein IAA26-like n=1 Tax=Andrographis paniculata TaxID=175694 RepID=UPI0021E8A9BA|nr:auxin-responsive protein IAA26-like [Andrographis paniculata]
MEGYSREDGGGCPHLLDLIPKDCSDWTLPKMGESEEKKLELSLGPPGEEEDWRRTTMNNKNKNNTSSDNNNNNNNNNNRAYFSPKTPVLNQSPWQQQPKLSPPFLQHLHPKPSENTTAQKRTAPAPVVGWPPVRSFRKNISSSKLTSESPTKDPSPKPVENSTRTPFVKINMDGIPIGRKVDLKAYDSYEKLSYAVDELFRGLLAAQRDSCVGGSDGGEKIEGILDGSGEYTLVYEDNEGDRMLVGDVPWDMFVSSVKRLRVLKSSELPKLSRGRKQGRLLS